MPNESLERIEAGLQQFPPDLLEEFHKALPAAKRRLSVADVYVWGQEGTALASGSFRAWEAAAEYFRTTPAVLRSLNVSSFLPWTQAGKALAQESPALAIAFFRATSDTLRHLQPDLLGEWAKLGKTLYKGTWRSSSLACRFFELSPLILGQASLREATILASFLDRLAARSYDLAIESLNLAPEVLTQIDRSDRDGFLDLACLLAEVNPRDAKVCFEVAPKTISRIRQDERFHFLTLVSIIARSRPAECLSFFQDSARSLGPLDWALHPMLLSLADELISVSPEAAALFIKNCPEVLARLRPGDLQAWFREGQALLKESPEAGTEYFRLESRRALEVVEHLASGMELGKASDVLQLYCRALTGRPVLVMPTPELTKKNMGWASPDRPTTEGNTIFLPTVINYYPRKEENFQWAKVASTHQAGHIEFGSFDFVFDRAGRHFPNLRQTAEPAQTSAQASLTEFQRFFNLFPERKMASDAFIVMEDTRLDHLVKMEYRGIKPLYERIQKDSLEKRPDITTLPLREAILENLLRLSLGQGKTLAVPSGIQPIMKQAVRLQAQVRAPGATVEDSAEATLRLYRLLASIPNVYTKSDDWQNMDVDQDSMGGPPEESDMDVQELLQQLQSQHSGENKEFTPIQGVDFRGEFKPELVQVLKRLEQKEQNPISAQAVQEALEQSTDVQTQQSQEERSKTQSIQNLMKEAARRQKSPMTHGQGTRDASAESLDRDEPSSFLYDEWDFRAGDYKARWCRVRERVLEEGSPDFYEKTLREYHRLASQIKKQFELITPELLRKMKKLPDGEEYELDAVIEAMVDRRAGHTPSEKVYWQRNKIERDVAMVFLLDMSASTAEAVDEMEAYSDPSRYRRTGPGPEQRERPRDANKRIIDVEKESAVLLIKALETIGDTYGIYAFSGYGRENVEFFVVKDLNEVFSDQVKRRLDKVAPLQATRMGPAIRHAIFKLSAQDARTRILFLLSDGRPQDHGYSRDGVEKEYAIHDTRMALLEARRNGIVPFCITVDKMGHDYLKDMCNDMGYEVVDDIYSLPKRLPVLYRRLTT